MIMSDGVLAERVQERLRVMRLGSGYSQNDLADMIGIGDGSFVSKHERGVIAPELDTVERYAKALEVPLDTFFIEDSEFERLWFELSWRRNRK